MMIIKVLTVNIHNVIDIFISKLLLIYYNLVRENRSEINNLIMGFK